ncbi:MAG: hypothetical protein JSS41_06480 [Proteobacteria bacterium]|nr:hypothetical protein [Pseudomonadota bacterium]MBS0465276.1 hypothetical protein [Pseudomonadota bacterium]
MKRLVWFLLGLAFIVTTAAQASERFPWKFGMSREEVSDVAAYGPYKRFQNGDLETYKGVYEGKEQNFQFFFFGDGKLHRIGIYLYEGNDANAAVERWLGLYDSLRSDFGVVEALNNSPPRDEAGRASFTKRALELLTNTDKMWMRPAKQPSDATVSAMLAHGNVQGVEWYYVILVFDDPRDSASSGTRD